MASGVKKLQINVDVQAAFSSALKQADNFKKKLSSLSLPKTITKDLEKDLADYQKNLQKILNFKPTTNNLGEYRNLISQLNDSFKQLSISINSLESNTEEAFSKNPKIENYKQQIENLKKEIQALDKATKSYYGVTSSDSKAKQDAARKEKQELTAGLTGAAAESTAKKQEQMTAALKESAKAKEKLIKLEAQLEEATIENNKAQQQAVTGVKNISSAYEKVNAPIEEATEVLSKWNNETEQIKAQEASSNLNNTLARWTGIGIAVQFARNQLQKMKETYLDLDASLTQIAVVSGRTRDQMWDMIGTYNEMAQRLGATTSQVVESSKLYFQQGRSQSEVMELVEQTTILATISELDFADATNYLTAAINGFKLEADDASNITDVWANLAAKAAVDTNELAVAISKVASIAKSAGADIETTSAFLTKMIETTREAPENLGTALKTIIARFQELKDSTEALEDGVDANKVEKALKQADVALRDSAGQFRDFDDVIMELSSKWDGLDRNTQRYIATIAAGARQQSRFIALVEDYDRNVELVNMAQNSAGASAAQFNTQLTGLEASMNRLQAAWEGLYTSFNASNIFSNLIDGAADLIANLSDLGLGFTTLSTIAIFAFSKIAIASAASSVKVIAGEAGKLTAVSAVTAGLQAQAVAAKASLLAMAPQLIALTAIIAGITLLAGAIYGLNRIINKNKIASREAAEALQEYTGKMGAANQEIESLETLQEQYQEAYKKGEDLAEIKQQLIDQFPDAIEGLDIETASYSELTNAINEYIIAKRAEAAEAAIGAIQSRKEKSAADYNDEADELASSGTNRQALQQARNAIQKAKNTGLPEQTFEWDGETVTASEYVRRYEKLQEDIRDLRNKANEDVKATAGEIQSIAAKYILDEGITGTFAQQYVTQLLSGLTSADIDEKGLKEGTIKFSSDILQSYVDSIDEIMNSGDAEVTTALASALSGNPLKLTKEIIERLKDLGFDIEKALPEVYSAYQTDMKDNRNFLGSLLGLNQIPGVEDFPQLMSFPDDIIRAWRTKFEEAKDNDELTSAYKQIFNALVNGINIEEFKGDMDALNQAFNSLDPSNLQEVIQILAMLEEGGVKTGNELVDALMTVADTANQTLSSVIPQTFELAEAYKDIDKAINDGLDSEEEAFNLFQQMAETMPELENLTMYDIFSFDGENWKLAGEYGDEYLQILQAMAAGERDLAIAHIDEAIAKNNQGIAYNTAVKNQAESLADEIESKANAVEANEQLVYSIDDVGTVMASLLTLIRNAPVDFDSLTGEVKGSAEKMRALASDLRDVASDAKNNASALEDDNKKLEGLKNGIISAGNATKDYDKNLRSSTKSSGKATDAAKAYADALKEQAEALKDAAEAEQKRIETEVEGIKKVLEARKKALEEQNETIQKQIDKEKEAQEILLEAYLKYLEKRKDEYQQTLDDMEKAAEKAREAADESNENLTFQNQMAQDYYKDQIELIDEKINALNEEAEAEDRLQKLQEARDAYERAKNTKNRLVLVRGAGWVFKRDQEEISSTYDALRDAEREVEIAKLNEEKELLQDQADAWAEKAENIGKTTEELEKYNKAYKEFANMTEEQRKEALNAFIDAVIRNNQLNQDATDKENAFEDQSDAEKEGTLAWNIAKVEELSEQTSELIDKIGKSAEELIKDNKINQVVDSLDSLLGEKGIEGLVSHLDTLTHGVNSYIDNFLKLSEQMTQNESAVEAIDKALEDWDELTENLGKSQSELNKELQLFNYYNQMTIEQLSKDSAVYNDIANQVSNLADQWERVNAAQAAYEAAQARADAISKASKNGEGYATGGVNTYTGLAAVHGTKSRPEVFLNNSQAGALFKFIDGLTRMPTLNKRNTPQNVVASTSKTEDNSTNYTNCKFEVVSNEDSIDGLLQDVKNRSPLRKF